MLIAIWFIYVALFFHRPCMVECKRDSESSPIAPAKDDFQTVNRFESHGGGWGYSGHSVEAIRFMCDTDILLGNYCKTEALGAL